MEFLTETVNESFVTSHLLFRSPVDKHAAYMRDSGNFNGNLKKIAC